jgi:peroxiredoxin
MNIQRLLVSSCAIAAVIGVTSLNAHSKSTSSNTASMAGDPKQKPKPPDKPKPKAPDKPKAEKPKEAPKPEKKIAVGSEVDGAISLTDVDGKAHKLSDMRGKVVVLEFWSAKSAESSAYDKKLAELLTTEGAKGVTFIGIDSDKADFDATVKDPNAALKDAMKTRGLDKMTLVPDKDGALMTKFAGKPAPYALVIDAKGVLHYAGPVDEDPKGEKKDSKHFLSDAIESAMNEKPAPPAGGTKEPPKKSSH